MRSRNKFGMTKKKIMVKKTFILLSAAVLATSCSNSKFPGYEETGTGAYLKIEKPGDGKTNINQGDVVFMHHTMTTQKDSVLYDYRNPQMSTPGQPYAMRLQPSVYKGDMFELMYKLHVGDSASFALRIDSMFKKYYHQPIPKFLDSTGYIIYHVKIDSLYTSAKVDEIEKKNREMQEAYFEKARVAEDSLLNDYLAKNKINAKPTASGLYIIIKEKGKGPQVKKGDNVEVNYKGTLTTGQVFDETAKHGEPLVFAVGMQQVIPAWDEAFEGMNVGTKATIISPSKLAYGPRGSGPIPPYAPLVFEVEVLGIKTAPPAPAPGK